MIFISHRGNINGPNPDKENNPKYLMNALYSGYSVEADVWYDKGWWLGHDEPKYKCKLNSLIYYWCHAKNTQALYKLINEEMFHCFWHQEDDYTLTSKGFIWVYPGKKLIKGSICVMPEREFKGDLGLCAGICSDEIEKYKKLYENSLLK